MNEYTNVVRGAFGGSSGRATAVTSLDDDPEKAARAIQLGEASGESPAVVFGDLENYDKNYRRTLTGGIVEGDEHLSEYATSDPMAAKVSNDDWGQLGQVTKALERLRGGAIEASVKGFKEGFGEEPWGSWIKPEQAKALAEAKPFGKSALVAYQLLGLPIEGAARIFGGLIKGGKEYVRERMVELGTDPATAERFTRDMASMVEYQLNQTPTAKLAHSTGVPRVAEALGKAAELTRPPLEQFVLQAREAYTLSEPYLRAGKEPPFGLHPILDELKKRQSEQSLEIFDDIQKEAQKSATRERAPAMFEGFVRLRYPDTKIGISADAVAELYKGKMPHAEDGLLGWVPNLEKQMYTALATGGDVEVPLAGWLARVDPEVAKELHDFIRVRPGDLTKFEATEVPKTHAAKPLEESLELQISEGKEGSAMIKAGEPPNDSFLTVKTGKEAVYGGLASVPEALRGQGIGISLYEQAIKYAEEKGLPFRSDMSVSADADRVYQSLKRRGYQVIESENSTRTKSGVSNATKGYVYEVRRAGSYAAPEAKAVRAGSRLPLDYGTGPRPGWNWTMAKERVKSFWGEERLLEFQPMASTPLTEIFKPGRELDIPSRVPLGAIRQRIMEVAGDVPVYLVTNADFKRIVGPDKADTVLAFYNEPWRDIRDHIVVPTSTFYRPDVAYVVFHEAIHAATGRALTREPALRYAIDFLLADLVKKDPKIKEQYGLTNSYEFLAEALSSKEFQKALSNIRLDEPLAKALGMEEWRGKSVWQAIVDFIRRALRLDVNEFTALEAALRLAEEAVIRTEALGPGDAKVAPQARPVKRQPELPGITRQEDLRIFQTITGWMNKTQYDRYMELIAKRNQEDAKFQEQRAEKILRRQMTQEWKRDSAEMKQQVLIDLNQRPDISALEYLRSGKLYGEETGTRPRINPKDLTEEQLKIIPEKYLRRDGMDPSDISQLFGFTSFDEFALRIRQLDDGIGKGSLPSYLDKLATQEAEKRMLAKHGDLEENILREAQDHVITDTQMDLLHEEVVALGMKTGSEMTFTKADFKAWVAEQFKGAPASAVSMEKYLKEAGAAGRKVEAALLTEDPTLAFQEKQRQLLAMLLAEQAKKFEKETERFDRLAKRMSQRVVKGMDQSFVDWTQSLMLMAGEAGKRTALELAEAVKRSGFDSLRDFVDHYKRDGWELEVPESVLEGNIKPRDQMTVEEFRDFNEGVSSLASIGSKVQKVIVQGEAIDRAELINDIVGHIRQLPPRDKNKPTKLRYYLDAELTKIEEMVKDLDLREELGPLWRALMPALADSKHTEFSMLEKLTKDLKAIKSDLGGKWRKSLKDDIPQDFLTDPYDGVLFDTAREHMINIMLHFGNRSNIEKFTMGFAGKDAAPALEVRLWQWFDQHATKQDWQYVQAIWDIFEGWRKAADDLYYDLSGVPPKWIPPTEFTNKHGTFKGGYLPIIYDRLRSDIAGIEAKKGEPEVGGLFPKNYFRATPSASYAKARTGYVDIIDFNHPMDQIATRMQQTVHDIAFRRAIVESAKIVYDKKFLAAVRKHYGAEYEQHFPIWLEHTANYFTMQEKAMQGVNSVMRRARMNLVTHALGYSLKIIGSPATGLTNPADMARFGAPFSWRAEGNTKLIMEKSRELPHTFMNIDRDFREQMEAAMRGNKWSVWQAKAMQMSFYPIVLSEQYFRKVTFFNEYKNAIEAGRSEGDAIALADGKVRERHGSGAVHDLPRIMRSNESMKLATTFYGFFNTMYNWQRQIPGAARKGDFKAGSQALWGAILVPSAFGIVVFNKKTEDENPFASIAKGIALQLGGTVPFLREASNLALEGQSARSPWSSLIDAVWTAFKDIGKRLQGKKPANKELKHVVNAVGMGAGLPLGQAGRTGQFAYDVSTGAQRPKNIWEWMRGVIHGEAKLKKR